MRKLKPATPSEEDVAPRASPYEQNRAERVRAALRVRAMTGSELAKELGVALLRIRTTLGQMRKREEIKEIRKIPSARRGGRPETLWGLVGGDDAEEGDF